MSFVYMLIFLMDEGPIELKEYSTFEECERVAEMAEKEHSLWRRKPIVLVDAIGRYKCLTKPE